MPPSPNGTIFCWQAYFTPKTAAVRSAYWTFIPIHAHRSIFNDNNNNNNDDDNNINNNNGNLYCAFGNSKRFTITLK